MPSKIIINPRAERNRPMNVSGWWKKNVEKWACRATISSPDKYPGSGFKAVGESTASSCVPAANPDDVIDYHESVWQSQ
ncbi:MAG: hypothetical protein QGI90_03405 [Nitrospinaceae bacterium]|jgi:hypothetical protein|nr:hypothetical protein [Nitrospinaceae bacterium]